MKVLVVGGGGREHALAWKIGQSDRVNRVFVAPGNAGTALEQDAPVENVDIADSDIAAQVDFAKQERCRTCGDWPRGATRRRCGRCL